MRKLDLPKVTLCAATSVNVDATLEAIRACLDQINFADCLFFSDAEVSAQSVRRISVRRLRSGRDYSDFLLHDLIDHVRTSHCLIVQWDGFVIDASCWDPAFLEYDYIGAPWPQFQDGHDVGNGGFSLRSLRLLEACQDPRFRTAHPEDVAICRINRILLEKEHGIRFADHATAQSFAFERTRRSASFGFHGVFNMIPLLGAERFSALYDSLDDRRTVFRDYKLLMRQLAISPGARRLGSRLARDRLRNGLTGLLGRPGRQAT
jgi:hypothetical protein